MYIFVFFAFVGKTRPLAGKNQMIVTGKMITVSNEEKVNYAKEIIMVVCIKY